MRKVFMLTNGTISLEDGMPVSSVPSVPCHRSPEITNQSGYSYQAQLQPAMLTRALERKRRQRLIEKSMNSHKFHMPEFKALK